MQVSTFEVLWVKSQYFFSNDTSMFQRWNSEKLSKNIHPIEVLNYKAPLYKRKYINFPHFILALHKINEFNQGLLSEKWRP